MKNWGIKTSSLVAVALLGTTACSSGEQTLDKRQAKLAEIDIASGNATPATDNKKDTTKDQNPASQDPVTPAPVVLPINELKYVAPTLVATKALDSIKVADVLLASKVSATETVIFAKDGKSYSYKPEATVVTDVLKPIEAVVVAPAGATLYSLPDSQFWFIAQDKLGRRKQATATTTDEKSITVEQFSTKTFQGDLTKMKVLYVSLDEVIFLLDTHIAIINVKTSPAQIKQLPIASLPVDLSGALLAGKSSAGYWFKTKAGVFFLSATETADASPWTKAAITFEPQDMTMLAMWPDVTALKGAGGSVSISAASGWVSDVPAAAATTAAK